MPSELFAADRVRCRQTLEPLAEELGVVIANEPELTEEAYADDRKAARHRIVEIAETSGTPVICTQGKVIPDFIALVVRARRGAARQVAQPQGQHVGDVAGRRPAGRRRPHRQPAGPEEVTPQLNSTTPVRRPRADYRCLDSTKTPRIVTIRGVFDALT